MSTGKLEIVETEAERKLHMDENTAAVKQGVITQDVDKGALCLTDPNCPGCARSPAYLTSTTHSLSLADLNFRTWVLVQPD
jgi:hypothetical protein